MAREVTGLTVGKSAPQRVGPSQAVPLRHLLLATGVVAVWGSNFVVVKLALAHLPPLLMAALRFALAAFPAVLFIRRPATSWRNLAVYGLLLVGQFGLLYLALNGHIAPGLASLVIQAQVFFTIILSTVFFGEHIRTYQRAGLAVAVLGFAVVAAHANGTATATGLVMVLLAAFAWAGANMVNKRAGRVDMLGFMVWSSLVAVPALLALSVAYEGMNAITRGLADADWSTWTAILWQAAGNTLFGFAAWGWLLGRYPAAAITPMSLLVPVFGMAAAAFVMGEALSSWKLLTALLVMAGLALNAFSPRVSARLGLGRLAEPGSSSFANPGQCASVHPSKDLNESE